MHISMPIAAVVTAMTCGLGGSATAQESHRLFEVEGVMGRTAVDVAKWGRVQRVDHSDRTTYGFNARFFVGFIGANRFGFEIGSQRLFAYELATVVGTTVTREKHTEAASHIGAVARFPHTPKLAFDLGVGFHYLSDISLLGVHFATSYRVVDQPRFAIPLGFRMDAILNSDATAVPMTLKTGVSIKL